MAGLLGARWARWRCSCGTAMLSHRRAGQEAILGPTEYLKFGQPIQVDAGICQAPSCGESRKGEGLIPRIAAKDELQPWCEALNSTAFFARRMFRFDMIKKW